MTSSKGMVEGQLTYQKRILFSTFQGCPFDDLLTNFTLFELTDQINIVKKDILHVERINPKSLCLIKVLKYFYELKCCRMIAF